jgi:hypothetical protein
VDLGCAPNRLQKVNSRAIERTSCVLLVLVEGLRKGLQKVNMTATTITTPQTIKRATKINKQQQ